MSNLLRMYMIFEGLATGMRVVSGRIARMRTEFSRLAVRRGTGMRAETLQKLSVVEGAR